MNTLDAIYARRSIRRFQDRPVPREVIERLLEATIKAPSAKNGQPWRLVVLQGEEHRKLALSMDEQASTLEADGVDIGSLRWTARAMLPAPVTVLFFMAAPPEQIPPDHHEGWRFVMLQSVGGAIQTMLLAATDLGIGSLWICDVLYCLDQVHKRVGHADDTLVAAVTLGYADEAPDARPRRPWQELTEWLGP